MATVTLQQTSTTVPISPTPIPMPVSIPALFLYRMTYDLYERIAEAGLLGPKDRVILLDGFLVNLMPIGPKHSSAVARGQIALQHAAPEGWYIRAEQPIVLRGGPNGDSAPQPDLAVVLGTINRYDERHPIGLEVGLIIEVATDLDALRVDRAGLARYAHAGIPIVAIVNIPDQSIGVYSEPSGLADDPTYRHLITLRPGQFLTGEIGNASTGPAAIAPIPVEAFFAPKESI